MKPFQNLHGKCVVAINYPDGVQVVTIGVDGRQVFTHSLLTSASYVFQSLGPELTGVVVKDRKDLGECLSYMDILRGIAHTSMIPHFDSVDDAEAFFKEKDTMYVEYGKQYVVFVDDVMAIALYDGAEDGKDTWLCAKRRNGVVMFESFPPDAVITVHKNKNDKPVEWSEPDAA